MRIERTLWSADDDLMAITPEAEGEVTSMGVGGGVTGVQLTLNVSRRQSLSVVLDAQEAEDLRQLLNEQHLLRKHGRMAAATSADMAETRR